MSKELDPDEIKQLRADGYNVDRVNDLDNAGYVWTHKHGASQLRDTKQPPRRTAAQAWYDCAQYAGLNGGAPAEPDWVQP